MESTGTAHSQIHQVIKQVNQMGETQYLWCAVDQRGSFLDILVQRRRDKTAAKTIFRMLLKG